MKDIKENGYYRWIIVAREGCENLSEKVTETIVVDPEAAIYDLFLEHKEGRLGKNSELLIRASHNRKILGKRFSKNY